VSKVEKKKKKKKKKNTSPLENHLPLKLLRVFVFDLHPHLRKPKRRNIRASDVDVVATIDVVCCCWNRFFNNNRWLVQQICLCFVVMMKKKMMKMKQEDDDDEEEDSSWRDLRFERSRRSLISKSQKQILLFVFNKKKRIFDFFFFLKTTHAQFNDDVCSCRLARCGERARTRRLVDTCRPMASERIDSVSKNAGFGNQRQPINKFLLHTMEGTG
jgi:hypothetical protein